MNMKPLIIGNVKLDNPVILGPMAGVTDLPFCLLCREQGAGLVSMEMVSANAIHYHNRKTETMLRVDEREHPVSMQLFGSDPAILGEAVEMLEDQPYDVIDFNMGCPVNKVVRNGEGSALMKEPELAGRIVRAMVRAAKKPVTVKIRKGFDDAHVNAVETAKILEDAGVSAITVHGRTREQFYSGKADWEIIRLVKEAVSVPVIGNGDVDSPEAAEAMLEQTGCDGIMVSRGARGDPWIFRRICTYLDTGRLMERPSVEEVRQMILRHARMMCECKGEYIAIREMRSHIAWYSAGFPHAALIRREAACIENRKDLEKLIEMWGSLAVREEGTVSKTMPAEL